MTTQAQLSVALILKDDSSPWGAHVLLYLFISEIKHDYMVYVMPVQIFLKNCGSGVFGVLGAKWFLCASVAGLSAVQSQGKRWSAMKPWRTDANLGFAAGKLPS